MGFSLTLSEIIMVIASVVLASSFSAYAIYAGTSLQSNVLQGIDTVKTNMNTRVDIVYATIDEETSPKHFVIYVKNTGTIPLKDFVLIDVYVGEYRKATLYSYNPNAGAGSGKFNLTDVDSDGVWEIGETATIRAFPKNDVNASLYEARIVPYRGIPSSYLFSPPG